MPRHLYFEIRIYLHLSFIAVVSEILDLSEM